MDNRSYPLRRSRRLNAQSGMSSFVKSLGHIAQAGNFSLRHYAAGDHYCMRCQARRFLRTKRRRINSQGNRARIQGGGSSCRLGLGLIQIDPQRGAAWRAAEIQDVARAAEDAGFEAAFCAEVNNDAIASAELMGLKGVARVQPAAEAAQELNVRRLFAGERWIRTIGSAPQQALCRARVERPGRDDPLRRHSDQAVKQSWIN